MAVRARLFAVVVGLSTGVAVGEGALRVGYDTLPSLQAAVDDDFDAAHFDAVADRGRRGHVRCSAVDETNFVSGPVTVFGSDPVEVWFSGDSVTAGFGVGAREGFPERVGLAVAEQLGQGVRVRNLAFSGADFCMVVGAVHQQLATRAPRLVVLVHFPDDLEDRAMVRLSSGVVAFPASEEGAWLRALVRRSYLANLAWFTVQLRTARPPLRFVGSDDQQAFVDEQLGVHAAVEAAGGEVLHVLLPAPGEIACPNHAPDTHRCSWMPRDLDLMHHLLVDAGLPVVDLRGLWDDYDEPPVIESEHRAVAQGSLGIHPHADGHAHIAEALVGPVAAALARSPAPRR